jgi:hypothetical protein
MAIKMNVTLVVVGILLTHSLANADDSAVTLFKRQSISLDGKEVGLAIGHISGFSQYNMDECVFIITPRNNVFKSEGPLRYYPLYWCVDEKIDLGTTMPVPKAAY